MEDDLENSENIQELESHLYAQVFYECLQGADANLPNSEKLVPPTTTENVEKEKNNGSKSNRYWSNTDKNTVSNNVTKFNGKKQPPKKRFNQKIPNNNNNGNEQTENVLKPFKPYEPIFDSNQNEKNKERENLESITSNTSKDKNEKDGNTIANENQSDKPKPGNNNKKSKNKKSRNKNKLKKTLTLSQNLTPKTIKRRKEMLQKVNYLDKLKNKKAQALEKMIKKKKKAENARKTQIKNEKNENKKSSKSLTPMSEETICLISSSEDESDKDVICIPAPAPPLVTVDDSEDENSFENKTNRSNVSQNSLKDKSSSSFVKPKNKKLSPNQKNSSTLSDNNSSRCTSPGSVISDDFIGQADRSRLLEVSEIRDDDDLLLVPETVNSVVNKATTMSNTKLNEKNKMPPPTSSKLLKEGKKKLEMKKKSKDYCVSDKSFRATDVYSESESDISVYSKGSKRNTNVPNSNSIPMECISSSSSDIEEIDVTEKVKRFRKRRASGNKDSESNKNIPSGSGSEDDDNNNASRTGLSFITRGEAVETCKKRSKRSQRSKSFQVEVNSSDNEFISQLSNILQGNSPNVKNKVIENSEDKNDSDSPNEEVDITARKIAEDVLKKSRKKTHKIKKEPEETIIQNVATNVNIDIMNKDSETAVHETVEEIDNNEIFEQNIDDSINKDQEEQQDHSFSKLEALFKKIDNMEIVSDLNKEIVPDAYIEIAENENSNTEEIDDSNEFVSELVNDENCSSNLIAAHLDEENIRNSIVPEDDVQIIDGVTYYKIESNSKDSIGWCEEMVRFYDRSWGGEYFRVDSIKKTLDRSAKWTIYKEDRNPRFKKFSRAKCYNCCEFGHIAAKCTRPRKPLICYMCGEEGHREPRCPNTICLKCGTKSRTFTKSCYNCNYQRKLICPICKMRGHSIQLCPDKWRRYHSTIAPNAEPNNRIVYTRNKWCSVCCYRGHLAENCRKAGLYLEYEPFTSDIISHTKSYGYQNDFSKLSNDSITYNLLYKPDDTINFSFSSNTEFTEKQYYGRFLKAVHLKDMFTNKKNLNAPKICDAIEETQNKDSNRYNKKKAHKNPKKCFVLNPFSTKAKAGLLNNNSTTTTQQEIETTNDINIEPMEVDTESEILNPKEITSKDNNPTKEHQFKSPKNVPERISKICTTTPLPEDTNSQLSNKNNESNNLKNSVIVHDESAIIAVEEILSSSVVQPNSTVTKEIANIDSDSNYSFSEHFDVPQSCSQTLEDKNDNVPITSTEKSNRNQISNAMALTPNTSNELTTESLDFIPLTNDTSSKTRHYSTDDGGCDAVFNESGISHRFVASSDDEYDDYNIQKKFQLPDTPSVAKIFLPKNFSDFLLSPEGNKFLVENSKKHDITASFEWTSVGNRLRIKGLKVNQDKFHTALLLSLRSLPKMLKNDSLEKFYRVPRKRVKMINFLTCDLNRLETKLGNPSELHKQLKVYEHLQSKNGIRLGEKIRSRLNMILLGQAELRNGKTNLEILINKLKHLIDEDNLSHNQDENITIEMRNEIDKSWKYIFSPMEHENYDEMVDTYYNMKRNNELPLFKFRDRLRNNFEIDVSLSNEQIERMNNSAFNAMIKTSPVTQHSKNKDYSGPSPKKSKLLLNTTFYDSNMPSSRDSSFSSYMSSVSHIHTSLDVIESNLKQGLDTSEFWSQESLKYLNEYINVYRYDSHVLEKLERIKSRAEDGLLNSKDCQSIIALKKIISYNNNNSSF